MDENEKIKKSPKSSKKKRRNRDDVSLLRTVLKQAHLQSVAMSQEFQMEDEENNKRKMKLMGEEPKRKKAKTSDERIFEEFLI